MANFKTHFVAATTISGLASVSLLTLQLAKPWETGSYFLLGILGGLLPDIDSDKSTPLTMIFYFLSTYCAFASVFNLAIQYSYAELFIVWFAVYFAIRYLVYQLFTKMTIHRGVFHSLLAVVFMALLTVNLSYHALHKPPYMSWYAGAFLGIGYLVHLTLDECYSVDLHNRRMKKSFGTALKPISLENKTASLLMAGVVTLFIYYAPPIKSHWQLFNRALAKHDLQKKWLPQNNRWFENLSLYNAEIPKSVKTIKKISNTSPTVLKKELHETTRH
jgi:hypothetical protein